MPAGQHSGQLQNKYSTDNKHTNNTQKKKLNRLPKICFTDLFYVLCTLIIATIMTAVVVVVVVVTECSRFQFKICFNKVIGFLKYQHH